MTREEFMAHARVEIDKAFDSTRNRLMNLVEQAWAEGKRNAETEQIKSVIDEALVEWEKAKILGSLNRS